MKLIPLTKGYFAQVDDEEFERCMEGPKWYANVVRRKNGSIKNVYAQRTINNEGTRTSQQLHRFILKIDSTMEVDHAPDHSGLNNTHDNLRVATKHQNMHNQLLHINNTSGIKGVSWDKRRTKWHAHIHVDGVNRHLGYFTSLEEAKQAYDAGAIKYFGKFACTNAMLEAAINSKSHHQQRKSNGTYK